MIRAPAAEAAVTELAIAAVDRPRLIDRSSVGACERLLETPGLPAERYDRALWALAGVVYGHPDLVGEGVASGLRALFAGPPLPPTTYRLAADVLGFLLATPAAGHAVDLLLDLLSRPERPPPVYEALLQTLRHAAFWAIPRLDLGALISLAECEHLAEQREVLLHAAIERAMFAVPTAITGRALDRLTQLYRHHPSWKYCLAYLANRRDVPAAVRRTVVDAADGLFPLRATVERRLGRGRGPWRALVVQNINDGQGDEIIRVIPLVQSLLDFTPQVEVVLVTARVYLYAHPRIRPVAIDDCTGIGSVLRDRFDAVIDFFEPNVRQVNYNLDLEDEIQRYVRARAPVLYLASDKGWNHFLYQRLDLESRPYAASLGLDRPRVQSNYETTFRLIAELGLPLRSGQDPPATEPVLAGIPCPEAEAAWSALTGRNAQRWPVALVCPFGGGSALKGYVERKADDLADQIRGLIAEGFYVVLHPNGTPWGSAAHARRVVDRLGPGERAQVTIAPDPAEGSGSVTYEGPGTQTVPYASYVMRLTMYFVQFADLIVTIEGWMMHAASCLGKRYRVLMLPHSPSDWFPYGRTRDQDVTLPVASGGPRPPDEGDDAPPLPDLARKPALLSALRGLGVIRGAGALPVLRRALRSEDSAVRLAAVESLGRYPERDVDPELLALLGDSSSRVRAAAAGALLERDLDARGFDQVARREQLLTYCRIGQQPPDWVSACSLGDAALEAVRAALRDDDPVVRREAAEVLTLWSGDEDRRSNIRPRRRLDPRRSTGGLGLLSALAARVDAALPLKARLLHRRIATRLFGWRRNPGG